MTITLPRGGNARDRRRMRRAIRRRSWFRWPAVNFAQHDDDMDAMDAATFRRLMGSP